MRSPRLFRVFVSSTFSDFQLERQALQDRVFPRIREYCEARGARFQSVDLRWGISEEAGRRRDTMRICLDEVTRCRSLSPRPNFIVLLGNRYGWRPLPATVPAAELELLLSGLTPEERGRVEAAFKIDDNAIPPSARLRDPDDDGVSTTDELALLDALSRAAARAGLPPEARLRYGASATHQEIVRGALGAGADAAEHVFCYSREIDGLPADPDAPGVGDFADLRSGRDDDEARRRLEALRDELRARLATNFRDYRVRWNVLLGNPDAYITRLCSDVEHDLTRVIAEELGASSGQVASSVGSDWHRGFAMERGELVVGRDAELAAIRNYLAGEVRHPLVVRGDGGSGKSAVLARAWLDLGGDDAPLSIARFVGATPDTLEAGELVDGIVRELVALTGIDPEQTDGWDAAASAERLALTLRMAARIRSLVVFVDGVDQLADGATFDDWLTLDLPAGAKVVVSTRPERRADAWIAQLPASAALEVPPLSSGDGEQILEAILSAAARRLTAAQRAAVLESFGRTGLPLHLRIAANFAVTWSSYDPVPELAGDVHGLIRQLLANLGLPEQHGAALVEQAAAYLTVAKSGLSEQELMAALSSDERVMHEFRARSRHPWDRPELPPIVWARLRADLAPWIVEHIEDGSLLMRFFHREFDEVIASDVTDTDRLRSLYTTLARVLAVDVEPGLFRAVLRGEPRVLRALAEVPHQLTCAGDADAVVPLVADMGFAMAKCAANRGRDLAADWDHITRRGWTTSVAAQEWAAFVGEHQHVLERGDESWRGHQILLQLACEHDDGGVVQRAAEAWLQRGLCDWLWLRAPPRTAGESLRAPLRVLAQRAEVSVVIPIGSGNELFAAGAGGRARIWSTADWRSEPVRLGLPTAGAGLRLSRGRIAVWDQMTVIIVERDGRSVVRVLGPSPDRAWVLGGVELPGEWLLTWSYLHFHVWDLRDSAAHRVWDVNRSEEDRRLGGCRHGALALSRDRLLIWHTGLVARPAGDAAPDSSPRPSEAEDEATAPGSHSSPGVTQVWDVSGGGFAVLTSWPGRISGAIELDEETILTWASSGVAVRSTTTGAELAAWCPDGIRDPTIIRGALAIDDSHALLWTGSTRSEDRPNRARARIWNHRTGAVVAWLDDDPDHIQGAVLVSPGRIAAWNGSGLALYDVSSAPPDGVHRATHLTGHAGQINGGLRARGGNQLVTWGADGTIRWWETTIDLSPGPPRVKHAGKVTGAITAGSSCLSWGEDGAVLRWDVPSGVASILERRSAPITQSLPLNGGAWVALWTDAGEGGRAWLKVWSVESGGPVSECPSFARIGTVTALDDGALLIWGVLHDDEAATLGRWRADVDDEAEILLQMPALAVDSLCPDQSLIAIDGRRFLVWGDFNGLIVADLDLEATRWLEASEPVFVTGGLLLRDGQHVLTFVSMPGVDHKRALWNLQTGFVCPLPAPELPRIAREMLELPDGRILLRDRGPDLIIRRLEPWTHELTLHGHSREVERVHVVSEGLLVSWTIDGEFILWDLDADAGEVPIWRTLSGLLPDASKYVFHASGTQIVPARLRDFPAAPRWHAGDRIRLADLRPDGTLVVLHDGGLVSFPAFWLGTARVDAEAAVASMVAAGAVSRDEVSPRIVHVDGGDVVTRPAVRYCIACGQVMAAEADRCPRCSLATAGSRPGPDESQWLCQTCGEGNRDSGRFCWHCGAAV